MTTHQWVLQELTAGHSLVLITILARTGSTPRGAGACMALSTYGSFGTIGGGLAEARVTEQAQALLTGGEGGIIHIDMNSFAPDADLICGGNVDVLLERLSPNQRLEFHKAVHDRLQSGLWIVDLSNPALPCRTYQSKATLPPALRKAYSEQHAESVLITQDTERWFLDSGSSSPTAIFCGGGHVSLAAGRLAHTVGFQTIFLDDRPEFASPARFPFAEVCSTTPDFLTLEPVFTSVPLPYILILTRGHQFDQTCLRQALSIPTRYIGMIGSRRKRETLYTSLRQEGFSETDLARIHCPIGLSISAESPEEIAVAIVAELISTRRNTKRPLERLRDEKE